MCDRTWHTFCVDARVYFGLRRLQCFDNIFRQFPSNNCICVLVKALVGFSMGLIFPKSESGEENQPHRHIDTQFSVSVKKHALR